MKRLRIPSMTVAKLVEKSRERTTPYYIIAVTSKQRLFREQSRVENCSCHWLQIKIRYKANLQITQSQQADESVNIGTRCCNNDVIHYHYLCVHMDFTLKREKRQLKSQRFTLFFLITNTSQETDERKATLTFTLLPRKSLPPGLDDAFEDLQGVVLGLIILGEFQNRIHSSPSIRMLFQTRQHLLSHLLLLKELLR